MQGVVNWDELGISANQDRRSESRIAISIPIEVTGFDVEGKFFVELTETIDVSQTGCGFWLRRQVERGGIVAIKLPKGSHLDIARRPLLYQVARTLSEEGRWITGAAKLQAESLWSLVSCNPTEASARSQSKIGYIAKP